MSVGKKTCKSNRKKTMQWKAHSLDKCTNTHNPTHTSYTTDTHRERERERGGERE